MIWFLLAVLITGLLIFAMVSKSRPVRKSKRGSNRVSLIDREFVARKWAEIQTKADNRALTSAISEADKLLDYSLKNSGVRGETMGERLKNSGKHLSDINAVWAAHKLRNALAHEADFDLVSNHAREALAAFEQGLKDLGAL